jgi:hypothetical protein
MSEERLSLTVYQETQVLIGFINQPHEQRLLDLLNSTSLGAPETSSTFLELSDVTIFHTDGKKEKLPTAYINKATIQLAATPDVNSARGIGAKAGPKSYPFVPKSPVGISLQVPAYVLVGSMHCAIGEVVRNLLGGKLTFLPVTDAKIRPITNGLWWTAPFVAVNKEQIVSLRQEEIAQGKSLSA